MLKTNLLTNQQCREIIECKDDLSYFCNKYIFKLMNYQERLFDTIESSDNLIFSKFRGGGFSTQMQIYILWCLLFNHKHNTVIIMPSGITKKFFTEQLLELAKKLPEYLCGRNALRISSIVYHDDTESQACCLHYSQEISLQKIIKDYSCAIKKNCDSLNVIVDDRFFLEQEENDIVDSLNFIESEFRPYMKTKFIVFGNLYQQDDFYKTLKNARNGLNKFSTYSCSFEEMVEQIESSSFSKKEKQRILKIQENIATLDQKTWMIEYCQQISCDNDYRSIYEEFIPSSPF